MKKCYKELATEKLNLHKSNGRHSNLSIFQVAELFDVVTGKSRFSGIQSGFFLGQISLN